MVLPRRIVFGLDCFSALEFTPIKKKSYLKILFFFTVQIFLNRIKKNLKLNILQSRWFKAPALKIRFLNTIFRDKLENDWKMHSPLIYPYDFYRLRLPDSQFFCDLTTFNLSRSYAIDTLITNPDPFAFCKIHSTFSILHSHPSTFLVNCA